MHVIMGGTGHVGSATAEALLRRHEAVTILTRDPDAAPPWRARGAEVIVTDSSDAGSLRDALRTGDRALLINPPADPATDTDAVEHRTADVILEALDGSGLDKVVAVSTYGAQPGDGIGDLGTLWRFEEGLRRQSVPVAINRHAYYMSNWDGFVEIARDSGILPSMLPAGFTLPMVAPADLGEAAAERLVSPVTDVGVEFVEGPARYSPADVAAALSDALGRKVEVDATPPESFEEAFRAIGFSASAAASYAGMTRLAIGGVEPPDRPWRGRVTLQQHVSSIVASR